MKHFILFFTILLLGCSTKETPRLQGSWASCQKDGRYRESKIEGDYLSVIEVAKDTLRLEKVHMYRINIQDSLLIITTEIGKENWNEPDIYRIKVINPNLVELRNEFVGFELQRLAEEIPNIDSTSYTQLEEWYINKLLARAELANCPDLRTEEEKNPTIIGHVVDEFEEIIEIPYDPELDGPIDSLSMKQ